jgi:hypothetical protein
LVGLVLLLKLEVLGVELCLKLEEAELEQLGQLYGLVGGEEKMWEVVDVMGLLMTLWYGRKRQKPVN